MRFVLAALVLAATPAFAAEQPQEDIRQTYQKGLAEYNLGNYAQAATLFEEVYRQKPAAGLLFNIAQCYRFVGNLQKASTTYRAYLRNAQPGDKNLARAKELLAETEKALEKQTQLANAAPHAPAQAEIPSEPNKSRPVVQEKPAVKPPVVAIATPPLAQPASTAQQAPVAAVKTTPLPAPVVEKSHTVAWIAGGGAALALAGGAFFGMKSSSTLNSLQTSSHPQAQIDADAAAAKSDAGKANLMFAAGAVLAVASATFFVIGF